MTQETKDKIHEFCCELMAEYFEMGFKMGEINNRPLCLPGIYRVNKFISQLEKEDGTLCK